MQTYVPALTFDYCTSLLVKYYLCFKEEFEVVVLCNCCTSIFVEYVWKNTFCIMKHWWLDELLNASTTMVLINHLFTPVTFVW